MDVYEKLSKRNSGARCAVETKTWKCTNIHDHRPPLYIYLHAGLPLLIVVVVVVVVASAASRAALFFLLISKA
jgi:hypothetical protein